MLTLDNIHKVFGKGSKAVPALKGIRLKVSRGEALCIFGPSGSGKTTLLEILGALSKPTEGSYAVDGKPVADLSDREMSRLRNQCFGFVFQTFNLIPRMSVFHNVELPLKYGNVKRAERISRVEKALENVGLLHKWKHPAGKLSGGEQQRVAIARAVVSDPDILLADEPTGNLDSENGAIVTDLLTGLWKQGKTLVLITHNETLAQKFDRMLNLFDGQIQYDGPLKEFPAFKRHASL